MWSAAGLIYGEAIEKVYREAGKIHFDKMHYRRDIGRKAC